MAIIQHRRSVEAKMGMWVEYEAWRRRREDLIREAQEAALAREARKVRAAFAAAESGPLAAQRDAAVGRLRGAVHRRRAGREASGGVALQDGVQAAHPRPARRGPVGWGAAGR